MKPRKKSTLGLNSRPVKNTQPYPSDLDNKFSRLSVSSSKKSLHHQGKTETKVRARVYTEASSRQKSRELSTGRNESIKNHKNYLKKNSSDISQKDSTSRRRTCNMKKDQETVRKDKSLGKTKKFSTGQSSGQKLNKSSLNASR